MSNARPSPSRSKKHDPSSASTITPQRKHRKLLKDGSGTEVWPEAIEKIFVQGLKEYWDSPYATYSQSRGRSRWRNQFLVDYLHKQGIERSKKQVASHIQVLRNMWKGEAEYQLVAGGDELYPEGSPTPIKTESDERWESNSLLPLDHWDDTDLPHSNTVSPDFSPADSQSEFPPTPEHRPNLYPSDFGPVRPKPPHVVDFTYSSPEFGSPSLAPHGDFNQQGSPFHDSSPFPMFVPPTKYPNSAAVSPITSAPPQRLPSSDAARNMTRRQSATPTHYRPLRNRVTGLFLSADGMTPFSVKLDGLTNQSAQLQPPFTIRVRLCVPNVNDPRSPPMLQGFMGTIALENVWAVSGRCLTKVYTNGTCIMEETGLLDITHINIGTVNANLPDSQLSRCRWLDPTQSVVITQEIIVDDETLLFTQFELDRRHGPLPAASLSNFQKFRSTDKATLVGAVPPHPTTTGQPIPHPMYYGHPGSQPYGHPPAMRYPSNVLPNF